MRKLTQSELGQISGGDSTSAYRDATIVGSVFAAATITSGAIASAVPGAGTYSLFAVSALGFIGSLLAMDITAAQMEKEYYDMQFAQQLAQ